MHPRTGLSPKPRLSEHSESGNAFVMIDGFNLSLSRGTGVATYGRNLSYALRDLKFEVGVLYGHSLPARYSPLLREVLFFDAQLPSNGIASRLVRGIHALARPGTARAFEVQLNGTVITAPFKSRLPYYDSIWNAANLYSKAAARFAILGSPQGVLPHRKPDAVHWTYPLPVFVPNVPNVYTLHDLVPLRLPYTTLDKKERYLRLLQWIARHAAHIVTVSENSRQDIIDILGVPPEKVTNTYQAVTISDEYRTKPEEAVSQDIGTFGLSYKEYFLYYGSIEPKKNVRRITEAYLASGISTPLVIVGAQAWKENEELELLTQIQAQARSGRFRGGEIVRLEYAPFELLVSLIRGAKAVLFPSLYEGFGLPILESMLLGTPVLTSNTSSLPEIAGDAALLVDPYRTQDIAQGISELDTNDDLRTTLAERGQRQATRFSETAYRDRLSAVYDSLGLAHER